MASGEWRGTPVKLVKPVAFMNVSGPVVRRALHRLREEPTNLILVYDDIDLPLGKVRIRMKGSHGGHNGMRSVIEALGTDEIRRVKVGVGRPDQKAEIPDHVLTRFSSEEEEHVAAALRVYLRFVKAGVPAICPHLGAMCPSSWAVSWDEWLSQDFGVIDRCTQVVMLEGWETCPGARAEKAYAESIGVRVLTDVSEALEALRCRG